MLKFFLLYFFVAFFTFSCSKDNVQDLAKPAEDEQMITAYKEAVEALEEGSGLYAAKKFSEAESLYPQSVWASRSAIMSAYSLYTINFYSEAIFNLERFIKIYPNSKHIPYVHYLIAICYFEQILDERKDLKPLLKAKEKLEFILTNFPKTDYAIDGKYKLDLIIDQLAAKEMYIGRYYMKIEKWIPAINRFKYVVEKYSDTVYVEEALHRLVEIYYRIGLIEEAKKSAILLGYNYQSGEWYKKSYKIFNKSYNPKKIKKKKKKDWLLKKKIKSLFE